MSEFDEVERYRRLLEDWQPGPASPGAPPQNAQKPKPPAPSYGAGSPGRASSSPPPAAEHAGAYARGAILDLGGQAVAVYVRAVPDKNMHLVMLLAPDGLLKTQGVLFEGQRVEELGTLPPNYFERLQGASRWERDLIVFHCYRFEDTARIPRQDGAGAGNGAAAPTATTVSDAAPGDAYNPNATTDSSEWTDSRSGASPAPHGAPATNGALRRGQWLHINFGKNKWDAVYWGKDAQGQVVAHKTYEKWALMHLDLDRFKETMRAEPDIDPALLREIEDQLGG